MTRWLHKNEWLEQKEEEGNDVCHFLEWDVIDESLRKNECCWKKSVKNTQIKAGKDTKKCLVLLTILWLEVLFILFHACRHTFTPLACSWWSSRTQTVNVTVLVDPPPIRRKSSQSYTELYSTSFFFLLFFGLLLRVNINYRVINTVLHLGIHNNRGHDIRVKSWA